MCDCGGARPYVPKAMQSPQNKNGRYILNPAKRNQMAVVEQPQPPAGVIVPAIKPEVIIPYTVQEFDAFNKKDGSGVSEAKKITDDSEG